jgi:hypothetical protein
LRRRAAALAVVLFGHAILFALLSFGGGWRPDATVSPEAAVQLWLAPASILRSPAAAAAPAATLAPSSPAPLSQPASTPAPPSPEGPPLATVAAPPGDHGLPAAVPGPALVTALRNSVIGCAQRDAPWMSDAERAACRQHLAEGVERLPRLEGMPPEKHAYYAAVAQAQEDWRSGRNPGHLPFVACAVFFGAGAPPKPPPHALVLGPCMIEPPRGSLDTDVDVRPIGEARDPAGDRPQAEPEPSWPHDPLFGYPPGGR